MRRRRKTRYPRRRVLDVSGMLLDVLVGLLFVWLVGWRDDLLVGLFFDKGTILARILCCLFEVVGRIKHM